MAEWIGRRLTEPGSYDGRDDRPIDPDGPWPDAAWNLKGDRGGRRVAAGVTEKSGAQAPRADFGVCDRALAGLVRKGVCAASPAGPAKGASSTPPGFLDAVEADLSSSIEATGIFPNARRNPEDRAQPRRARRPRLLGRRTRHVLASLRRVFDGEPPGAVAEADHRMLVPRAVRAERGRRPRAFPHDLAGYRNVPTSHIQRSMHVPPSPAAVRDAMPAFFELLREEPEPAVRVVPADFAFVYVHPYVDGNGRIGRLLMNLMLTAAGYSWTIVPVERRDACMTALEAASVGREIGPFTDFLTALVA